MPHPHEHCSPARLKVTLITHATDGDTFWDLVRKGAEAAAAKDGIELTYADDPDTAGQAELVRDAVRGKADGITVTLAEPQTTKDPVARSRSAGTPVVGLNSGIGAWQSEGLLECFGQDESVAGRAVGDELDDLKARHVLCVIHERGQRAFEARCAGVKKTFGGQTEMLCTEGDDHKAVAAALTTRLRQDPTIEEVVTNRAQFALTAVKSVEQAGSRADALCDEGERGLRREVRRGRTR